MVVGFVILVVILAGVAMIAISHFAVPSPDLGPGPGVPPVSGSGSDWGRTGQTPKPQPRKSYSTNQSVALKWSTLRVNLSVAEIAASIQLESSGNPNAQNPGDPSWGLMGVTALISRAYLGDRAGSDAWKSDPDLNVEAGSGFLSYLKSKYSDQYPLSDLRNGWIQIYNVGETHWRRGVRNPQYQAVWMRWLTYYGG